MLTYWVWDLPDVELYGVWPWPFFNAWTASSCQHGSTAAGVYGYWGSTSRSTRILKSIETYLDIFRPSQHIPAFLLGSKNMPKTCRKRVRYGHPAPPFSCRSSKVLSTLTWAQPANWWSDSRWVRDPLLAAPKWLEGHLKLPPLESLYFQTWGYTICTAAEHCFGRVRCSLHSLRNAPSRPFPMGHQRTRLDSSPGEIRLNFAQHESALLRFGHCRPRHPHEILNSTTNKSKETTQ